MDQELPEESDLSPSPAAGKRRWREELRHQQSQVDALHGKLAEVKVSEGDWRGEMEHLCSRVKTIAALLTCLRSRAGVAASPRCMNQEGVGLGYVDRHGVPLGDGKKVGLESGGVADEGDVEEIMKSIRVVGDIMEFLVKRVVVAETEAASEKEKVKVGLEEIRRKTRQVETMSAKVEEMEKFAVGTNGMLNEMRQKIEDMVLETTRQRQRAAENEQELCRVKQDFESLRSYVSTLISARETLLSSEQFHTVEKLLDRLVARTNHLENEKAQKEAEVQKLMEENVRLRAIVDKKEAQLLAMSEQCKFMALNRPN